MKQKVLLIGGNGFVGNAIKNSLEQDYQVVITAGHHEIKDGYQLAVEDTDALLTVLDKEKPDVVISSIRGDFDAQFRFHETLADWLKGKSKRLLFVSTANVFDGDMSQPWTEDAQPNPKSDYGKYKRDCEKMLADRLPNYLIIFRPCGVWAPECPRIQQLRKYSSTGEPMVTYPKDYVNVTLTQQIADYAKYVLDHNLRGIFHVGSVDTVDYHEFQKMVCNLLKIKLPVFEPVDIPEKVYQAVIPTRKEIPDTLQLTVSQVLNALCRSSGADGLSGERKIL